MPPGEMDNGERGGLHGGDINKAQTNVQESDQWDPQVNTYLNQQYGWSTAIPGRKCKNNKLNFMRI